MPSLLSELPSFKRRGAAQILLDASDGASDYGNKFGEPLIAGYTRSYGQRTADGERREWIKPIMFRLARDTKDALALIDASTPRMRSA